MRADAAAPASDKPAEKICCDEKTASLSCSDLLSNENTKDDDESCVDFLGHRFKFLKPPSPVESYHQGLHRDGGSDFQRSYTF